MKRILVIAPHADDEVLGCGGYLLHEKQKGSKIKIVIGTIGGEDKRQKFSERIKEFRSVCEELGADSEVLYKDMDAMLDTISSYDITSRIDSIVDEYRQDEVFINAISRHQDHVKIYNCAITSMRLREGYSPKMIALYEYPFTLQSYQMPDGGKMYHDISDVIDDKVILFEKYASQIRKSPSPLNERGIKTLASIRGLENGKDYCEMFYLQKLCL